MKRIFDLIMSAIGILFLSPLMLAIAVWIKLDSKGPVLFKQERVGKDGEIFTILKFRTMAEGSEKTGFHVTENDSRITKSGDFLRKTSLDELPQLFNIFIGDMSIVGPRPTLKYQVDNYTDFQKRRLEVRPGVTGWAQVNGRNSLSWPERIKFDVWYVDNYSFWLDMKILWKTIFVWLRGEGIYAGKEKFIVGEGDEEKLG